VPHAQPTELANTGEKTTEIVDSSLMVQSLSKDTTTFSELHEGRAVTNSRNKMHVSVEEMKHEKSRDAPLHRVDNVVSRSKVVKQPLNGVRKLLFMSQENIN